MKRALFSQVRPLLPEGVHFDEVWVDAGGGADLSPLFPDEEETVERAVEKRRREFRAGRHVARRALALAGGPQLSLPRGVHGAPGFPVGYRGSITHTGRHSTYAAAVATNQSLHLGVDAELQDELGPELSRRIATAAEIGLCERVAQHPGLLAFAAKEAVYKCIYPLCERVLGFDEVRLESAADSRLQLRALTLGGSPLVEVRWLRAGDITFCLAIHPESA